MEINYSFSIDIPQKIPCGCDSGYLQHECCGVAGATALTSAARASIDPGGNLDHGDLTPRLRSALDAIAVSPDLFPARFDFAARRVLFTKMSPRWYRESAFLEPNRVRGHCTLSASMDWVERAVAPARWEATSLVFHTAFCGSTLLTRALEAVYDCLALREPEALTTLRDYARTREHVNPAVDTATRVAYQTVFGLLSRGYHPEQGVVLKANDNATVLMPELVQWRNTAPVLFMYVPLREFLVGCLRAEKRREWIAARYRAMRPYAEQLLGFGAELVIADDAFGEMAAMYWSYNVALYHRARTDNAPNLRSLEFGVLLADPVGVLERVAGLFSLAPLPSVNAGQALDQLFSTHAKVDGKPYSPQARDAQIARTLDENPLHLHAAEALARRLLADSYPGDGLPGAV